MTELNAKDFMAQIYAADTPADVDAAFAPISALKPAARRKAIDAVETEFLATFRAEFAGTDVRDIREALAARELLEKSPLADLGGLVGQFMAIAGLADEDEQGDKRAAQDLITASQVFFNIHKIKGEKADPLVKTFVAEAAKLSDEEYASVNGQTRILLKLLESDRPAVATPAAKPVNPFLKP